MLFPTVEFAIFFVIVFFYSWELHHLPNIRKVFLLFCSYFFYATLDLRFLPILILSPFFNFLFGLWIGTEENKRNKKFILTFSISCNLVLLGLFKYYNFFLESLTDLLSTFSLAEQTAGWSYLDWSLPLGISFFTFQGISYLVDIYRDELNYKNSLLDVLLFISFFPHLVAGPIVKANDFIPQLKQKVNPNNIPVIYASSLIIFGLFKKVLIANHLGTDFVDPVFDDPSSFSATELLMAAYGYSVQIFCDFSAYSDMAIGFAALLGYEFPINFKQPYQAKSLQDFWRRWHISLSSWLKNYVYQPLGGSQNSGRFAKLKTYRNLFLTMFLGGLWHGASWNFLIWGSLHGFGLALERFVKSFINTHTFIPSEIWKKPVLIHIPKLLSAFYMLIVFHFVTLAWIFFRAPSFDKAQEYLSHLLTTTAQISTITTLPFNSHFKIFNSFYFGLLFIGIMIHFLSLKQTYNVLIYTLKKLHLHSTFNALTSHLWQRWPSLIFAITVAILVTLITSFNVEGVAPFIYFRF